MAMKTVIFLSFIVLNNFFVNTCQGRYKWGAKGGGAPLNKAPPQKKTAQHIHPNFRYPCSSFKMVTFFWKPIEISEKSRPYWREDVFFWISTENLVKTRPTQKFWPLQKQILPPLELRSSCGIDMCVKKNCASPTRSFTARHCSSGHFHASLIARALVVFEIGQNLHKIR